jgi:hypothetical protein
MKSTKIAYVRYPYLPDVGAQNVLKCLNDVRSRLRLYSTLGSRVSLGNEEVSSSGTESNSDRQTANRKQPCPIRYSLLVDPVLMVINESTNTTSTVDHG